MNVMLKVTDPKKIVTDSLMLKRLAEQGVDKDYVEFWHDYAPRSKEHSPFAKFYRDLKSNKRFMVVSGLPMVKPDGQRIEIGWVKLGDKYVTKPNLFSAVVEGTKITVACLNGQPDGRKEGDKVEWQPQLYLNNAEQTYSAVTLLPIDPTNPNLQNTTLEWDYGICKRRIRAIQGRVREKWVFFNNPNGEVRIKHNHQGVLKLRLGEYGVGDEEIAPADVFNQAEYPLEIGASPETFYPDAHTEASSVDGYVTEQTDAVWATIRVAGGDAFDDTDTWMQFGMQASTSSQVFSTLNRMIMVFYTEGLPDAIIITDVTLGMYGKSKINNIGNSPNINIYKTAPASTTALEAGDFDSFTLNQDLATAIGWSSITTGTPGTVNTWTLIDVDSNDFGYISKTGATLLGATNQTYDADGATPGWSSGQWDNVRFWSAEQGVGYKPTLIVTYIEAPPAVPAGNSAILTMVAEGIL